MTDATIGTARGRLSAVLAFARSAEPRPRASCLAIAWDTALALALVTASSYIVRFDVHGVIAAVLICGPLAARRLFPFASFLVVFCCVLAAKDYATYFTFIALVIAAYSAVVHSKYRGAALLSMAPAGSLVAVAFWDSSSRVRGWANAPGVGVVGPLQRIRVSPNIWAFPGRLAGLSPAAPWRVTGILVLVCLATIAIVGVALYAADRIRALKAGNQEATRRAVEVERARIASELHDVVTHNVSVMIVQAGAARQVLANSPAKAKEALVAVEASGRAAMTELRSLLGLLTASGLADRAGEDLRPQPGLGQIDALISRVAAAGLPVKFDAANIPGGLPPGIDLAAFRVIQEGLTNVIKHAGKPSTTVSVHCRDGDLIVAVADAGRPIPAAGPIVAGGGHGLLGLRERIALYGGELLAGPQPAGGWLVRARIPVDPVATPTPTDLAAALR